MAPDPAKANAPKKPSPYTPKRITIGVLVLLAVFLIVTNFETTTVNLFMAEIRMPLSLMLAVMFGLGWVSAALTSKLRGSKG